MCWRLVDEDFCRASPLLAPSGESCTGLSIDPAVTSTVAIGKWPVNVNSSCPLCANTGQSRRRYAAPSLSAQFCKNHTQ